MSNLWSIGGILHRVWPRAAPPRQGQRRRVESIQAAACQLNGLRDRDLAQQFQRLRRDDATGSSAGRESQVVHACALVVESARRTLGISLYDVQLLGGLVLSQGAIAEMQTGEGKTFVAMLPACLHALAGQGVHVMTVNAYLARRDFELLAPVYRLLGLSAGLIDADLDPDSKRAAYGCDITYGPGYEFGFDYLRDQAQLMSRRSPPLGETYRARLRGSADRAAEPMQRGHAVAIVDEADSVFLDEATTPLLLAAGGDQPAANADVYLAASRIAKTLECDEHYVVDHAASTLQLTRDGVERLNTARDEIPRRGLQRSWPTYVEQALRAEQLYCRDVHYIVEDDAIQLVDQYTGRIFADRTWRDGLHQAVQAEEQVTITTETNSIARITRQRYFRLYEHLCGMTGTAQGSERELRSVYGLDVVVIPPHRPCRRVIHDVRGFPTIDAKEAAVVNDVARIHRNGQPVLVGTATIESSERIAGLMTDRGLTFQLLNGRQDAEEASIVARAGQSGAITIATNMAGRGTDIKLGPKVADLGGLHVISTEAQPSARIDRQLVGRAARQGDPGSCQLFVSAEDELLSRHAPALARRIQRSAAAGGEAYFDLAGDIAAIQRRLEQTSAKRRGQMFAHDDWLENILNDLNSSK